jgi:hypothetical protein
VNSARSSLSCIGINGDPSCVSGRVRIRGGPIGSPRFCLHELSEALTAALARFAVIVEGGRGMWKTHDIPVQTAARLASLFLPCFEERYGCVFLAGHSADPVALGTDFTGAEEFANHVHVLDLLTHAADVDGDQRSDGCWYDPTSADFLAACTLGKVLARSWFLKLRADYPQYRFRVYYTEQDNPIVRFHRVRDGEPFWLSEADWLESIAKGEVVIFDTIDDPNQTKQ